MNHVLSIHAELAEQRDKCGSTFAIAAVVMSAAYEVVDRFYGRRPLVAGEDYPDFVIKYVLPELDPVTHPDGRSMRTSFWGWLEPRIGNTPLFHRSDHRLVAPAAEFMQTCIEEATERTGIRHTLTLHDSRTVCLAARLDWTQLADRIDSFRPRPEFRRSDASTSFPALNAAVVIKAMKVLGSPPYRSMKSRQALHHVHHRRNLG